MGIKLKAHIQPLVKERTVSVLKCYSEPNQYSDYNTALLPDIKRNIYDIAKACNFKCHTFRALLYASK